MKALLPIVTLVTFIFARGVESYSIGAPSFACDPLTPSPIAHLGPPQTTAVPYTIDVSIFNSTGALQYNPGQTYTGKDWRDFFLISAGCVKKKKECALYM